MPVSPPLGSEKHGWRTADRRGCQSLAQTSPPSSSPSPQPCPRVDFQMGVSASAGNFPLSPRGWLNGGANDRPPPRKNRLCCRRTLPTRRCSKAPSIEHWPGGRCGVDGATKSGLDPRGDMPPQSPILATSEHVIPPPAEASGSGGRSAAWSPSRGGGFARERSCGGAYPNGPTAMAWPPLLPPPRRPGQGSQGQAAPQPLSRVPSGSLDLTSSLINKLHNHGHPVAPGPGPRRRTPPGPEGHFLVQGKPKDTPYMSLK